MSYIAPENLTPELQNKLKKIDELELSVEKLEDNPTGIEVLSPSQDIVLQNSDLSFDPDLILVNNYIHYSVDNQIPSPTEFKVYYILSNQQGSRWEHNEVELLPPSSIIINLVNFPEEHLPHIQYIHIDTIKDGVITNSKLIPIVRNGKDGVSGIDGKDGKSGINGVDGRSFTFDDLTPDQIELLRGVKGDTGEKGDNGDANVAHYDSNGSTSHKLKIFTTETVVIADGIWTVSYGHVGFEKVLNVQATPKYKVDSLAESPIGAIVNSFDTTSATGKSHKGTSAGLLLGMANLASNKTETKIQVLVIGY